MERIANPRALQTELRRLLAACEVGKPSRQSFAAELRELAKRVTASMEKQGAEEIPLEELPADRQRFYKKLESKLGKAEAAWDGIHGYVVHFAYRNERLTSDMLKLLLSDSNFRWVDSTREYTAVGM